MDTRITLMGKDLSSYRVTYPENGENREIYYAMLLHGLIRDLTGAEPEVGFTGSAPDGREIAVGGAPAPAGKFSVRVDGKRLCVCGNDVLDYEAAYDHFRYTLFKKGEEIDIPADYSYEAETGGAKVRVGEYCVIYHNIWGLRPVMDRFDDMLAFYRAADPDFIGVNEHWYVVPKEHKFEPGLEAMGYAEVYPEGCPKVNVTTAYYKTSRFDLLDQKWVDYAYGVNFDASSKSATIAVLRDKATAKVLILVSSHLSAADNDTPEKQFEANERRLDGIRLLMEALAEFEAKYPGAPILIGGDYNADYTDYCRDGSRDYTHSQPDEGKTPHDYRRAGALLEMQRLGFVHAADIAGEKHQYCSCHGYPVLNEKFGISMPLTIPSGNGAPACYGIDHTYIRNADALTVHTYRTLQQTLTHAMSDHCPQMLEFTLK